MNQKTITDIAALKQFAEDLLERSAIFDHQGQLPTYIPELASMNTDYCGLAISTVDGCQVNIGNAKKTYTIQSISKVFALVLALRLLKDELWQYIDMEPSGQKFNSFWQLESDQGRARNPFINAGALRVTDLIMAASSQPNSALLNLIRAVSRDTAISINQEVYRSELRHGHLNLAVANILKAYGQLQHEAYAVSSLYFQQCAIEMNCSALARSLLFLANRGTDPFSKTAICSPAQAALVNTIVSACGMYDQSTYMNALIGLPSKSGVSGGVVAIAPGFGVISAWSPLLNQYGNSVKGVWLVKELSQYLGWSVFGL